MLLHDLIFFVFWCCERIRLGQCGWRSTRTTTNDQCSTQNRFTTKTQIREVYEAAMKVVATFYDGGAIMDGSTLVRPPTAIMMNGSMVNQTSICPALSRINGYSVNIVWLRKTVQSFKAMAM